MQEPTQDIAADNTMLLKLTSRIIAAYLGNNQIPAVDIPEIVRNVHSTLHAINTAGVEEPKPDLKPAVNPKKSVTRDYIICLEDGKKFKSLKRHLMTHFELTPAEYREKWGLAPDYPMVAPSYSEKRSKLAREKGLGRKPGARNN